MLTHGGRSTLLGCFLGAALTSAAAAQSSRAATPPVEPGRTTHRSHDRPTPSVVAVARATPIQLDGRLDEPAWQSAEPATGFRQQQPDDGQPATQQTEIRVLFDDEALYIGARMLDTEGAVGVRTMLVRRDQSA